MGNWTIAPMKTKQRIKFCRDPAASVLSSAGLASGRNISTEPRLLFDVEEDWKSLSGGMLFSLSDSDCRGCLSIFPKSWVLEGRLGVVGGSRSCLCQEWVLYSSSHLSRRRADWMVLGSRHDLWSPDLGSGPNLTLIGWLGQVHSYVWDSAINW